MIELSDMTENLISEKAMVFIKEVEAVCKKHGFSLSVSGYDSFQIWPAEEGMPSLYAPSIEEVHYVPPRD